MQKVMLQFKYPSSTPSIGDVCELFDIKPQEIDSQFGVIETDRNENLYTVLIDATATTRVKAVLATRPSDPAENVFANPQVEPFGPPEK